MCLFVSRSFRECERRKQIGGGNQEDIEQSRREREREIKDMREKMKRKEKHKQETLDGEQIEKQTTSILSHWIHLITLPKWASHTHT